MNPTEAWERRKLDLERRINAIREDLQIAEAELTTHLQQIAIPTPIVESALSPEDKIRLFRERFVGRDDVYARRWENPKTGKSGYSPACRNEWVRGICEKPKVRCAQCLHRDFLPLDESVLRAHLQGKLVAGVYPLTHGAETIFLAADFDGEHWRRDSRAALAGAKELGVPVAIERSRSGDGAHLWIFFNGPVPAAQARKLGFLILSRAMNHEDQLPLASYDRLFPNQDTMPDGGFGNLIALPLQREARERGNTLFLDEALEIIPDPWAYLQSVPTVSVDQLDAWVGSYQRSSFVRDEEDGEDVVPPWLRNPSRASKPAPITENPDKLKVVHGQSLFVEKVHLSPPIKARLKRLAILANPEFHRREAMRLTVAGTPRVIRCFEEDEQWLSIPRGCKNALEELARDLDIALDWEDQTISGKPLESTFHGDLRDGQAEAVAALEGQTLGILSAPPGSGKTVMASALIARRKVNTLILVHRQPLVDQWNSRLSTFLGLAPKEIGTVSGGKQFSRQQRTSGKCRVATRPKKVSKRQCWGARQTSGTGFMNASSGHIGLSIWTLDLRIVCCSCVEGGTCHAQQIQSTAPLDGSRGALEGVRQENGDPAKGRQGIRQGRRRASPSQAPRESRKTVKPIGYWGRPPCSGTDPVGR